jgi:hypothetical protein
MEPRFPPDDIEVLAKRYWNYQSPAQRQRELDIIDTLAPAFRQRGYLNLDELVVLAAWKSPRIVPRVRDRNNATFVREVTRTALSPAISEEMRIKILPILQGVQWAVASVVLHFGFDDPYPILDFRVLWSLQEPQPTAYTFDLWRRYTDFCRQYSKEHRVSMRLLDRALWTYSKERQ